MKGLYQRALELHTTKEDSDAGSKDEFKFDEDSGISKDDQKDILSAIEKVATKSRITITPEIFTIQALKRGVLFPFMVNLFSIIILAAGIFTLYFLFQRGEISLMEEAAVITTAEGKLIKELKKESEARLLEKNREIAHIQNRLEDIDREREDLLINMEAKISKREEELRRALESELESERAKLRLEGISEEDINRRLNELESEKSAEYSRQLQAYEKEAEDERIRMESNLKSLQEEYKNNLASANKERLKVLKESQKREEELKRQLDEKTKALESEKVQAKEELKKISDQKEQEDLANNQLIGLYNKVKSNIQSGRLEQALFSLNDIESFLNEESILTLPGFAKRREVEFFVVDSLQNLVKGEMKKEEVDTASLIRSANLVTDIKSRVIEAEALHMRGEINEAEKMYNEALGLIPEINKSHNFFLSMEREAEAARQEQLEEYLARAEYAFRRNKHTEAIDYYTKALEYLPEDTATIEKMISHVKLSGFELGIDRLERQDSGKAAGSLAQADKLFNQGQYNQAFLSYIDIVAKYPLSSQVEQALEGINKAADAINSTARSDLTETQNEMSRRISELEEDIKSRASQMESLQNEKRLLADEIASLNTEIEKLRESSSTSASTAELSETIKRKVEQLKKIEESYKRYAAREDTVLKTQGDEGLIESKLHLNAFLASTDEFFPGLWTRIKRYDMAFEQAGRSSAMQDVIDILYELSTQSSREAREKFIIGEMAIYRNDPIMLELLEELRELIKP